MRVVRVSEWKRGEETDSRILKVAKRSIYRFFLPEVEIDGTNLRSQLFLGMLDRYRHEDTQLSLLAQSTLGAVISQVPKNDLKKSIRDVLSYPAENHILEIVNLVKEVVASNSN